MIVRRIGISRDKRGMMDASATRRPVDATHLQVLPNYRHRIISRAHLAGAGWMEDGFRYGAHVVAKRLRILFDARLRQHTSLDDACQRRRLGDPDSEFDATHEGFDIRRI